MSRLPNIVFIFSDQQRWDTLGCYGQRLDVSPNLDKMAKEGVLFENSFTCQPVCGPARSCLQTGKYATETGCYRNNIALPPGEKTLAHYLGDFDYEVGYIGKWHLASTEPGVTHVPTAEYASEENFRTKPIPPERRGGYKDFWLASDVLEFTSHGDGGYLFDGDMQKVEFEGYRVDCLTDFALEYLRTRNRAKPFFLFLSYLEPHHQNDHNRYEGPDGSKERFGRFDPPTDLSSLDGDWPDQFPDYLGCCASIDSNIGRIRADLQKLGLSDNTIVFFASDHGCHFRTRNKGLGGNNYDDYKRSCHEASIHVPLIACGGSFQGGKRIKELVSLIDIPPTILSCAGIPKPEAMKGRSFKELAEGDSESWRNEVFLQISESQVGRALRTERWKYSVRAPGKSGVEDKESDLYVEDFLYDLKEDPHELNNLVRDSSYAGVRQELAQTLKRWMVEAGENPPEIRPAT